MTTELQLLAEVRDELKSLRVLFERTQIPETVRVMDVGDVAAALGVSKPTIYTWLSQGAFPQPQQLSIGRSGWLIDDIRQFIETRPRGVAISKRHRAKEART